MQRQQNFINPEKVTRSGHDTIMIDHLLENFILVQRFTPKPPKSVSDSQSNSSLCNNGSRRRGKGRETVSLRRNPGASDTLLPLLLPTEVLI